MNPAADPIRFPFRPPPTDPAGAVTRVPVVVIGAGPVGLALALDLAIRGVPVVVLEATDTVSTGSRAICWAKRTLEIFDRLGIGERAVEKGVTWQVGRVFHGERELYSFDLLPEGGHRMPAFVNLQQPYAERFLIERAADFPNLVDIRWRHEVTAHEDAGNSVRLSVNTPAGSYRLEAEWVVACDGARSPFRTRMGLPFRGQRFEERFLIADVRMTAPYPSERLFWFEPPFHPGGSALLHRQPDEVFRLDFQLGPDADPEAERRPERVIPRVRAAVGPDVPFELEWCSVYVFRCARLDRFVHGRVIFAGDSAHVVSPFGARGGNGGVQDADNLGWKLAAIVQGEAPRTLIDSYDDERGRGADENIRASSRTTAFMTPKSAAERRYRDAVLALATTQPFGRAFLNAGRLSRPCTLDGLPLQSPTETPTGVAGPGAPCPDAPVLRPDGTPDWLLRRFGPGWTLLVLGSAPPPGGLDALSPRPHLLVIGDGPGADRDPDGLVRSRYGEPGTAVLIRPDRHVAARFIGFDAEAIGAALDRGLARRPVADVPAGAGGLERAVAA